MPRTECIVCQRVFEKEWIVSFDLDEVYAIQKAEDMICSDKCQKVYEQTWANKKDFCFECGKKVKEEDIAAWRDSYEVKTVHPICEDCLYGQYESL